MENDQNHVWVSREEYDRLRQAQLAAPVYSANSIEMADGAKQPTPFNVLQVVAGAVLAMISFMFPPAILAFGVFVLVSIFDYYRAQKKYAVVNNKKSMNMLYLLLIILPLALFVLPSLAFAGFIVLMIFMCNFDDSCKGS